MSGKQMHARVLARPWRPTSARRTEEPPDAVADEREHLVARRAQVAAHLRQNRRATETSHACALLISCSEQRIERGLPIAPCTPDCSA